jgi:hypothetical protein
MKRNSRSQPGNYGVYGVYGVYILPRTFEVVRLQVMGKAIAEIASDDTCSAIVCSIPLKGDTA